MRFSVSAALAACCASAQAFSDSSPFVLFSTSHLPEPAAQKQLQSSAQVLSTTKDLLALCPTERYLVVSQPNLNADHLADKKAVPQLRRSLKDSKSSFTVAEVAGELDSKTLASYIRSVCDGKATVDELSLTPIPDAGAADVLKANDNELGSVLDQSTESLTVIYTSGLRTDMHKVYKPEFFDSMQTELKRQLHQPSRRADDDFKNLPLFEKYQYLTPGIFMAIVIVIILLTILYSGISAVASLEVPYGAFEKDMGPSAQKKQQ